MRVLIINVVCGISSTGRICTDIAKDYERQGHEVKIAYGRGEVPEEYKKYTIRIGDNFSIYSHALYVRLTDRCGFGSRKATAQFLSWADEYDPDLLWLHNLHGYYINIQQLFDWIKGRPDMKIQWTLHDCWAFTGHCGHFTMVGCNKWKKHCENCVQKRRTPASYLLDNSYRNYNEKKKAFTGIRNMKLIVPSNWLAKHVKESFLKEYPIKVHYNTVNKQIFKPTSSNFRKIYGLEDKKIILGVANVWEKGKGLDDLLELSKRLDDLFVIVIVGMIPKRIDKRKFKILEIGRINNEKKLAEIYSAADFFINPSREETFGLTTLEAIYCGTKTIVYDSTASTEVAERYGGIVIPEGVDNLYKIITSEK